MCVCVCVCVCVCYEETHDVRVPPPGGHPSCDVRAARREQRNVAHKLLTSHAARATLVPPGNLLHVIHIGVDTVRGIDTEISGHVVTLRTRDTEGWGYIVTVEKMQSNAICVTL